MALQTHNARQPRGAIAAAKPHRIVEFEPIPFKPNGKLPYHLRLDQVVDKAEMARIQKDAKLAFHCAGDTGGVKRPEVQTLVARGMEQALVDDPIKPAFFYHVGDVVYYNGLIRDYFGQFYEPYEHYPLPIVGIAGNHDGEKETHDTDSLEGFYRNFCAPPGTFSPESRDTGRMAMCQPYPYWTFETPFAHFIGLYTNVPEHGRIDDNQRDWFHAEMANAPTDRALIVALHHPVYSFDVYHSGSERMAKELEDAINTSRRVPNLVLTGHVHNYQRIEWQSGDLTVPFFVVGNGGYWHLHHLSAAPGYVDETTQTTLKAGYDTRHGFATFEVGPKLITGRFTTVPRPQESWSDPAGYNENADVFSYTAAPITLKKKQTITLTPSLA